MTSNFKKGQIKIRLSALTDINMSLMIANDTRGGIFTLFIDMQKLIINT